MPESIKQLDLRPEIKSMTKSVVAGVEAEVLFYNKYGEVGYWSYGAYDPRFPLNEDTELELRILMMRGDNESN